MKERIEYWARPDGKWHHHCLVRDGDKMTIYIDGKKEFEGNPK